MFGKKAPSMKEGVHVFAARPNGKYKKFLFGVVTGVDGSKIGINGLLINPIGLINKVEQGKAGPRSAEILENPTSENCIFGLIYRIEQDNFTDVLDQYKDNVVIIPPKVYNILDGWVRESLPELINNVLSLPPGAERDQARRTLINRKDTLTDKNLKQNLYSVCRSLKILTQ
ncbi:MAG: hypothetical protein DWQ18_06060 [Crenarchaeota archaeon]|nr:MAG: hypothetical protein DWQ17_07075 [Thermoproteota archaeon]RDJ33602.1 MAG: hypothetical protein DWQ18_06060 [Thermoproteota archaeon]RDJ38075.1 MAG: hypothetical protein DWQ19_01115 [Thermoproteota archaeon]RDJ39155.1 MAG: hypothetical protein DWQ13_02555 [Thermoproteota archaeon]